MVDMTHRTARVYWEGYNPGQGVWGGEGGGARGRYQQGCAARLVKGKEKKTGS